MKAIWCPWRIEYIRAPKVEGCVLCDLPSNAPDQDPTNLILYRGKHVYVMINRYPYNNGHLMVVPYTHVDTPLKLEAETLSEMWQLVNLSLQVLEQEMHPDGFNIGMNLGKAAGAGIAGHIHIHIVPRWVGDTNFMPVIGDTKVIVQSLEDCFRRLKPAFEAHRTSALDRETTSPPNVNR